MNTETNYADHFYADISNDIDTLRKNVNENPFSSVAQFLLLYNYKKNNDPSFEKYAKQTAIYFNNIPWIQYQLLGNNTDHFSPPLLPTETHEEIIPVNGPIIQNPVQGPEAENDATKETTNISDNIQTLGTDEIPETSFTADEPIIQNPVQEPETGNEATNETSNISDNIQTLGEDQIKETNFTADEPIIQNPIQGPETENDATKETTNISDNIQTLGTDEIPETNFTADEPIIQNPVQEPETGNEATNETSNISDNIQTLGTDEIPGTNFTADEPIIQNPIQEPETENEATNETSNISDNIQTLGTDEIPETSFTADEPIIQNPVQEPETENDATKETTNISDNIQTLGTDEIPETNFTADEPIIENSNQEPENEEEIVAFEPLHTVDYFASQGIKISEEALENDHLGQQVKSFTAWLKSMKKLHPGQLPEQNEVIEKIIQSSAEISNQNANVLTEAMAEVLLKQNKKQKAIEMYEKLSLMNPSKSSYFAAKIESLKTI